MLKHVNTYFNISHLTWLTELLKYIFVFLGSILIIILEYGYIPSSVIGYTCGDPVISHKYNGEVITPEILGVLLVFFPLIILTSSELFKTKNWRKADLYQMGIYVTEVYVGGVLTLTLTEVAKTIVAEHRPHFFDVCEPDTAKQCVKGTWIEDFKCTSTKYSTYFLVDSSRSFPSGHSSLSAFVGLYCAVSSMTILHTFNQIKNFCTIPSMNIKFYLT